MASVAPFGAAASLSVHVWSDVVCPWCFVGKRRLETAITQVREETGVDVEVTWRSFELDPTTPRFGEPGHGEDVAAYLGRTYGGGRAGGVEMQARVTEIAAGEGLAYRLADTTRSNTVDAHRLLHLALEVGGPAMQGSLKERLLSSYFEQARPVDDPAVLREVALSTGLPAARVDEVLAGTSYTDEVEADVAQAHAYGARGVPFTVVEQRYGVSGAQPVEVFAEALRRAAADRGPALVEVATGGASAGGSGDACGPDGCPV